MKLLVSYNLVLDTDRNIPSAVSCLSKWSQSLLRLKRVEKASAKLWPAFFSQIFLFLWKPVESKLQLLVEFIIKVVGGSSRLMTWAKWFECEKHPCNQFCAALSDVLPGKPLLSVPSQELQRFSPLWRQSAAKPLPVVPGSGCLCFT